MGGNGKLFGVNPVAFGDPPLIVGFETVRKVFHDSGRLEIPVDAAGDGGVGANPRLDVAHRPTRV